MRNLCAGRRRLLVAGRLFFILAACVPARKPRSVDPQALAGVALGVPEPADVRDTPGIGCGQIVPDLSTRAHKQVVVAFSNAGATVSNADHGPWVLNLAVREAGMGLENAPSRRTDRPARQGRPDMPNIDAQPSLINGGNDNAQVVIEATLVRDGQVLWRDTVTGHAKSAPCVQAYDKVREAMRDAIENIREQVIVVVRRANVRQ
jgi:hypothetical protein